MLTKTCFAAATALAMTASATVFEDELTCVRHEPGAPLPPRGRRGFGVRAEASLTSNLTAV